MAEQRENETLVYTLDAASDLVTGWVSREYAEQAVTLEGEWWIAPSRFLLEVEEHHRLGLGWPNLSPDGPVRFRDTFPRWMTSGGDGARMDDSTRTVYPGGADSWARADAQREFDKNWREKLFAR